MSRRGEKQDQGPASYLCRSRDRVTGKMAPFFVIIVNIVWVAVIVDNLYLILQLKSNNNLPCFHWSLIIIRFHMLCSHHCTSYHWSTLNQLEYYVIFCVMPFSPPPPQWLLAEAEDKVLIPMLNSKFRRGNLAHSHNKLWNPASS